MTERTTDGSEIIYTDAPPLNYVTITGTPPVAEPTPSYTTNKLFPHRHCFTLRLDLDKVYFQCEGCMKKLTVLEVERMLNK